MKEKIVLIVDDEDTMTDLIKQNLSQSNLHITVYSASSGEEGIAIYQMLIEEKKKPDLVIMDVNLTQWGNGKIDGIEATQMIMEMDPDASIFGYTAYFSYGIADKLEKAGAKKIIERTIRPREFRKIIEEYLSN